MPPPPRLQGAKSHKIRAVGGGTWWYVRSALTAVGARDAADMEIGTEVVLADGWAAVADAAEGDRQGGAFPFKFRVQFLF